MASTMSRFENLGRPMPPRSGGSKGASLSHMASVKKLLGMVAPGCKPWFTTLPL
jgi:hypothetical protein